MQFLNRFQLFVYIIDEIGLHRVENPSFTDKAVSLHLYSPPFTECASFDQRTGHKNMCKVTFYSRAGKRTPFGRWQKQPTITFHPTTLVSIHHRFPNYNIKLLLSLRHTCIRCCIELATKTQLGM